MSKDTEINSTQVVAILKEEVGKSFKANWTGTWHKYDIEFTKEIIINRGKGFEKVVAVKGTDGGTFIYYPPYKINSLPSETTMFLFYCDDALYIKGL